MPIYLLAVTALLAQPPANAIIQHDSVAPQSSVVEDKRDGQRYPTVVIGSRRWMARNLAFKTPGSRCYEDKESNCVEYGRLYQWDEAINVCPSGWRLASEAEYQAVDRIVGVPEDQIEQNGRRGSPAGEKLKRGGETGFDAQYGGWIHPDGRSEGVATNAALWTATLGSPLTLDPLVERAWHRDVGTTHSGIHRSLVSKPYWLSVRCVTNQ